MKNQMVELNVNKNITLQRLDLYQRCGGGRSLLRAGADTPKRMQEMHLERLSRFLHYLGCISAGGHGPTKS